MAAEAATYRIPLLAGGISQQEAEIRALGQVENAVNADFNLQGGCSKRRGTQHVTAITGLSSSTYAIRGIDRDLTERYILLTGANGTLRIWTAAGTEATVSADQYATAYLTSGSPTRLASTTIADVTILGNPSVPPLSRNSTLATVAGETRDYNTLISNNPTYMAVFRTKEDTSAYAEGFFQYRPGRGTFSTIQFNLYNQAVTTYAGGAHGFRIFFSRFKVTLAAATYTAATFLITQAGAFVNYVFQQGDQAYIEYSAGNFQAIEIAERVNANSIRLVANVTGSPATVNVGGIGRLVLAEVDFTREVPADYYDVARAFERVIRNAPFMADACVSFTYTAEDRGYMTVTNPWGGLYGGFPATKPTLAPTTASVSDDSAAGKLFDGTASFSIAAGTGVEFQRPPEERWKPIAQPDQASCELDDTTMPMRLTRIHPGGVYAGNYAQLGVGTGAYAYWRLGEAIGTVAYDEIEKCNGTYTNGVVLGVAGAINGSTNTAITLDGTNDYVSMGALPGLARRAGSAFSVECWVKTAPAYGTIGTVFSFTALSNTSGAAPSGTFPRGAFKVTINSSDGSASSSGRIYAGLTGVAWSNSASISTATTINDGNWHLLSVTATLVGELTIYLDGVQVGTSSTGSTGTTFFTQPVMSAIGCEYSSLTNAAQTFLAGSVDEIVLYDYAPPAAYWLYRYNLGVNAAYSSPPLFWLSRSPWKPRLSGTANTNPPPQVVDAGRGIEAIAYWQDKLVLGAGETLSMSRSSDLFNFFAEDEDLALDSDPINRTLGSKNVTLIEHAIPLDRALVVLTKAGRQFEVTFSDNSLTPSSIGTVQSTNVHTAAAEPVTINKLLYFAGTNNNAQAVHEYVTDETTVPTGAPEITGHVPSLIPLGDNLLATIPNENALVLAQRTSGTVYRYQQSFNGIQKTQSAWSTYTLSGATVLGLSSIGTDLWFLLLRGSTYSLEKMAVAAVDNASPFTPLLDGQHALTGVYVNPTTTWTLPAGATATGITQAVLASGAAIAVTPGSGVVTATGDYSASPATLGRPYTMTVTLSRPYLRDQADRALVSLHLWYREMTMRLKSTGAIVVRAVQSNRGDRVRTFGPYPAVRTEPFKHWFGGEVDKVTVTIENAQPQPSCVGGMDIEFDVISERA